MTASVPDEAFNIGMTLGDAWGLTGAGIFRQRDVAVRTDPFTRNPESVSNPFKMKAHEAGYVSGQVEEFKEEGKQLGLNCLSCTNTYLDYS